MYSVEWQKRGLPHAHILVWFIDKIRSEEIDSIISAEIPDPSTDQLLFDIVTTNMIHGPCGTLNSSSPCMADGKYIDIDNRWVVPYSPLLSKTYNAHINVEFCSSVKSIKYICKCVHKGSDMAVFRVENTNVNAPPVNKNDEITLYQIGRYISSNEAAWRIFGFPIHERDPAVVQLAIHLENGQRVFFTNETAIDRAINPPKTTLTAFFELCNRADDFGAFARTLHYSQVPRYFTWTQTKTWMPRKQGSPVAAFNPRHTECFYLRLLLVNVTGPLSFQDIPKVNGQQYPSYKDACLAFGLLEDDNQWECMLAEAALNCTAIQIRLLFAIVLTTCFPARAQILWKNHKDSMTDDILHQHRIRCHNLTITFSDEMYNEALIAIEDLCIVIANLPLSNFGMNSPNRTASDLMNTEMNRELQYISAGQGGFFFLDASGGTGKTFVISLILAEIRSNNGIALAVASSGIAATLLDGERERGQTCVSRSERNKEIEGVTTKKRNTSHAEDKLTASDERKRYRKGSKEKGRSINHSERAPKSSKLASRSSGVAVGSMRTVMKTARTIKGVIEKLRQNSGHTEDFFAILNRLTKLLQEENESTA
ncbi:uncharacterized protein LOC123273567 [Cotesia glomerata]|uniref:uncharacterized protein LOC123273567 n=1 Tax=Cotesia glomerata TaxID=32391 RepID=UPI001D02E08A|nr:uncharacterized protein LOC123273567 [Cotesia glomerata]